VYVCVRVDYYKNSYGVLLNIRFGIWCQPRALQLGQQRGGHPTPQAEQPTKIADLSTDRNSIRAARTTDCKCTEALPSNIITQAIPSKLQNDAKYAKRNTGKSSLNPRQIIGHLRHKLCVKTKHNRQVSLCSEADNVVTTADRHPVFANTYVWQHKPAKRQKDQTQRKGRCMLPRSGAKAEIPKIVWLAGATAKGSDPVQGPMCAATIRCKGRWN
jgi:hypothetical protein